MPPRGHTLYDATPGAPVARLRPTASEDRFEVLYWPGWKERCASTAPSGGTVLALDDTLKVIAYEDIFWTAT
jgi:hypothetical protein